ncbi:hypothetical protein B0A50_07609 [Salinomyces thailandicus]|uniref:Heat shock factor binding protein 1 n=1 Tax=Salinomyces thailandicus TaxID=706561 RepID=A0A4U0TN38_9PEZI|nr:hypothetical protein B0A50_07609 [Salinomyces thailandica]
MASTDTTLSAQVDRLNIQDDSHSSEIAPSELVSVVDDLLAQLQTKFSNVSAELVGKLDEMSRRLDNLEATIQASNEQTAAQEEEGQT